MTKISLKSNFQKLSNFLFILNTKKRIFIIKKVISSWTTSKEVIETKNLTKKYINVYLAFDH